MQIEIRTPEPEQCVRKQIQSGQFHDVDELLTKALDALKSEGHAQTPAEGNENGGVLLGALHSSPCPEVDLAPPREWVSAPVRDVVL